MKWDQVGQVGHGISTALDAIIIIQIQHFEADFP